MANRHNISHFENKVFEADCLDIMPQIPDKSGDIVLGNACGSGSFLVAAAMEGREYNRYRKE